MSDITRPAPNDTSRATPSDAWAGASGPSVPSVSMMALVSAAVIAVVLTVVLWVLIGWPALIVGVIVGALGGWLLVTRATRSVLTLVESRPSDVDADARFVNVVEGLALTAGMEVPELRVTDDSTINGMAVGALGSGDVLIVTSGALESLDRIALEGLLAHLVARLRRPEQASWTASVTTIGLGRFIVDRLGSARGRGSRDVSVEQQMVIDAEAVGLTRYPPGLIGAISGAIDVGTEVSAARRSTSHLWFAPVIEDRPQLEARRDALQEL